MPFLNLKDSRVYHEVHDLTPPWTREPEAVVFHHGIASDLHAWHHWLPPFTTDYKVIRFDVRGCGRSGVPAHGFPWSLSQLAADTIDVLQAAGVNRFHFIGDGLGATVGLYLATRYADRLLTLTAVNAVANGRVLQQVTGWHEFVDRRGEAEWARQMMAWRYYPNAIGRAQHDWLQHDLATRSPWTSLVLASVLAETDLTPELARIAVPTLLLAADASPFVPVASIAELHARITDAELHVVAHARDGLVISHAGECVAAARDFMSRRYARRRTDMPAVI